MNKNIQNILRLAGSVGLATMVIAQPQRAFADPQYTITDCGPQISSDLRNSGTGGINAIGQVVGSFSVDPTSNLPVLFDNRTITSLGSLGGTYGYASAINDHGQIVGSSQVVGYESHAFLYQNGVMTDLGKLGGTNSSANDINNLGDIVGSSSTATSQSPHAILIHNGTMMDIDGIDGNFSIAHGINDLGDIVGTVGLTSDSIHYNAFLYHNGRMTPIGSLSGSNSQAFAINNAGQIVGDSFVAHDPVEPGDPGPHAFLYSKGVMQDLGSLGRQSFAYAINNAGQIVGESNIGFDRSYGVIYVNAAPIALDTLIDPDSEWTIWAATGINDAGVIAAWGTRQGVSHALVLTPNVAATAKPTPPQNVLASANDAGQITVSWDLIPGVAQYNVTRSVTSGGPQTLVGTAHGVTDFYDYNLQAATPYFYHVTALNNFGSSAPSAEATATTKGIPPVKVINAIASPLDARRLQLTWDPSSSATDYQVYRGTVARGLHSFLASTKGATSFLDTNLATDTSYYYVVVALNAFGPSPKSNEFYGTTLKISPPGNLKAVGISGNRIDLSWDNTDGTSTHWIYRATAAGQLHQFVGSSTNSTFSDVGLQPSTRYYYIVTAIGNNGLTARSPEFSGSTVNLPAPVTYLTATAVNCVRIHLAWTASAGATSYTIYRSSTAGAAHTYVGKTTGPQFDDSSLAPATTAYYIVVAQNSNGIAPKSPEVHAVTPALPTVPTNLTASAASKSRIDLHWTAAFGASSYQIFRATLPGTQHSYVGTTTSTQFGNSGLPASTSYYYVVVAVNSHGSGPKSNEAGAKTLAH